MTLETFISTLVLSATATSLGIEVLKSCLKQFNIKYNTVIVATITSFIVGICEIFVLYYMKCLQITSITFIYALCMGLANVIGSTCGYDKIKEFILALFASLK